MEHEKKEYVIEGTSLSQGISIGKAFLYHDILTRDISSYSIKGNDVPYEMKRVQNAIVAVRKELYSLSRTATHTIGTADGNVFEAQRLMIEDRQFTSSFEKEMRNELINAEQVAKNIFRKQIERFDGSSNEILQAKADDLRDIFRKMLRSLLGIETNILAKLPRNAIIITRRLLPSDTVMLDRKNTEGILVLEGSVHAHSALLARSIGIPALCSNGEPISSIRTGDTVVIDGYSGIAIVNPKSGTVTGYRKKKRESSLEVRKQARVIKGAVKTKTGQLIRMYANANSLEEINHSLDNGCDGIGLFRTETLYLQCKSMPDEDTLYKSLHSAIAPIGTLPATIRLLDIGGDKRLPYFSFKEEFSPFLGLRGIRLLLKNPEILSVQLRALLRLSENYRLKILLPMISVPDELVEVRKILKQCQHDMGIPKTTMSVGSMIETPSAALAIEKIVQLADFISIGTNDLTQYVMAASRENPSVADLYEKGSEYILPLIQKIAAVCRESGTECSICGEIANDEKYLKKFIECGIYRFSVSAFRIPQLKGYIRGLSL
jgi:phosphotransferase system enzyme I (PtsI)